MGRRRISRTWVAWTQGLVLAWISATGVAAHAVDPPGPSTGSGRGPDDTATDDLEAILKRWQHTASARASAGYRDNVALSHDSPQASGFFRSAVDVGSIRAPLDGNQILLLFSAEDTRYFRNVTPDHEDLLTANAEWRHFFHSPWESMLSLEGIYLDQVMDVSITETNRTPLPLRGGVVTVRPGVRYEFSDELWMSAEVPAARNYFADLIDDFSELGPKVTIGWPYGNKSELTLSYAFIYRQYDTDAEADSDGHAVPGTHRVAYQHDFLWAWKHHWDTDNRWLTTTKLGFRALRDGASGYYDFERIGLAEEIRYRRKGWEVRAEVRLARYHFDSQTAYPGTFERRERRDLSGLLRAEATLARHLKAFAQYDYEQTFSNLALDEYHVNTLSAGLVVEF